jgi:cell division septum initiation protein DivIVA
VSLRRTLDVMGSTVERATSIPLSASCMVNRAEMLALVERARAELPVELDEAAALLVAHQEVIARAEHDAEQVLARARQQADAMVEDSALVATARGRSEQILDAARTEAARLLREADEYCDGRLAEFENDLERAMAQVRRGRDRLRERSNLQSVEDDAAEQELADDADYEAYEPVSVAYDQAAEESGFEEQRIEPEAPEPQPEWSPASELVPAQVGMAGERRVVDLAGMERGEAERSGLGQRANLQ